MFGAKRRARTDRNDSEELHQVHSGWSLPITAELLIGPKYWPSKQATTFLFRRKILPSVRGRQACQASRDSPPGPLTRFVQSRGY